MGQSYANLYLQKQIPVPTTHVGLSYPCSGLVTIDEFGCRCMVGLLVVKQCCIYIGSRTNDRSKSEAVCCISSQRKIFPSFKSQWMTLCQWYDGSLIYVVYIIFDLEKNMSCLKSPLFLQTPLPLHYKCHILFPNEVHYRKCCHCHSMS